METLESRPLATPPPQPMQFHKASLNRSTSRSRGINFNTVSPSPKALLDRGHTTEALARTPLFQASLQPEAYTSPPQLSPLGHQEFRYDVPLPLAEQLSTLDIDEQLRLLALKEMTVVEIKDCMTNMKAKLESTENDLHLLRQVIQRSLYKEMNLQKPRQRQTSNPREEALASMKQGRRRSSSYAGLVGTSPRKSTESDREKEPVLKATTPQTSDRLSAIWSNFSKPISFIQNLDTMIQNEFEKSLAGDQHPITPLNSRAQKLRTEASDSPLKDKSTSLDGLESFPKHTDGRDEDMFQAVSSSLWTFVNDMKTNMIASLNEPLKPPKRKQEAVYNLDNGSAVSLTERTEPSSPIEFLQNSDDDEAEQVDLAMYSNMRRLVQTKRSG